MTLRCPKCKSVEVVRAGKVIRAGGPVQGFVCKVCGHRFVER